jgi:hypothetical protein
MRKRMFYCWVSELKKGGWIIAGSMGEARKGFADILAKPGVPLGYKVRVTQKLNTVTKHLFNTE